MLRMASIKLYTIEDATDNNIIPLYSLLSYGHLYKEKDKRKPNIGIEFTKISVPNKTKDNPAYYCPCCANTNTPGIKICKKSSQGKIKHIDKIKCGQIRETKEKLQSQY